VPGARDRPGELSISFVKVKQSKPHVLRFDLRLFTSDGSTGWCAFSEEGKPGT
jgi:hypothetical protein